MFRYLDDTHEAFQSSAISAALGKDKWVDQYIEHPDYNADRIALISFAAFVNTVVANSGMAGPEAAAVTGTIASA